MQISLTHTQKWDVNILLTSCFYFCNIYPLPLTMSISSNRQIRRCERVKKRQVSKRIHTRKIDRGVIRHQMKKQGIPKPNRRLSEQYRRAQEYV